MAHIANVAKEHLNVGERGLNLAFFHHMCAWLSNPLHHMYSASRECIVINIDTSPHLTPTSGIKYTL